MDKEFLIGKAKNAKEKISPYAKQARAFLPPQNKREQQLVVCYSILSVIATAIINSILLNGFGGGSKTVFTVDGVVTYSNWTGFRQQNQNQCSSIDQSAEYQRLLSNGWKITSSQPHTKPVGSVMGQAQGECQGTLFILNK